MLTHGGIVPAGVFGLFPFRQKGEGQEREDPDGGQAVDEGARHVEAKETMSHVLAEDFSGHDGHDGKMVPPFLRKK